MQSPVMLTATKTYKVKAKATTQSKKHDADWTTEQLSPPPCGNTKGKLEFEEGAPESENQ